jgi:radical SAM enzyme (TIGR01210 family)
MRGTLCFKRAANGCFHAMKFEAQRPVRERDIYQPQQFFVEQECTESGEVVPVVTVFLTNRECPWRCIYCDLWKNTTNETVPLGAIPAQIDFALQQLGRDELHASHSEMGTRVARPSNVAKQIKLYNAGSFFDPKAIPPEAHPAIAERARPFERAIVECHPALVGESAVQFRDLLRPARLEVAMGLEVADDAILSKLNKRMTLSMFRHAADFLVNNGIAVRAFVIVKPPFVRTDEEAVKLAQRSIDFAFDSGATVVSLIPARFGAAELEALSRAGEFSPPSLDTLEESLNYGVEKKLGRVFADLWDIEKLGGCCHCVFDRVARLRGMNLNQTVSPRIQCSHDGILCASHR